MEDVFDVLAEDHEADFRHAGAGSDLVSIYRRKLATALY